MPTARTNSGRTPSTQLALRAAAGRANPSPRSSPPSATTGVKLIAGLPMKPATKRLAGRS